MQDNNIGDLEKESFGYCEEDVYFPGLEDGKDNGGDALRWCFTQWNYTSKKKCINEDKTFILKTYEEDLVDFAKKYCNWMVYGHETGSLNEGAHLQGTFILKSKHNMTWIKRRTNKEIHLSKMKKPPLANRRYCVKQDKDNYYEYNYDWFKDKFNSLIKRSKKGNIARSENYKKAIDLAKENKILDIDPELLLKNIKNLLLIRDMCFNVNVVPNLYLGSPYGDHFTNHFLWVQGGTGTLKSYNASKVNNVIYNYVKDYCKKNRKPEPDFELYKRPYKKKLTKWWNNYKFEKVVIIEEATKDFVKNYIHHIKVWFDQYAFPAEYKGGEIGNIRPEFIIVTSNFSMDDCFLQPEIDYEKDYLPIKRRFKEVNFDKRKHNLMWPCKKLLGIEYDYKKETQLYEDDYIDMSITINEIEGEKLGDIPLEINAEIIKNMYEKVNFCIDFYEGVKIYREYCKTNNKQPKSKYFQNKFLQIDQGLPIDPNKRSNDSDDELSRTDQNKRLRIDLTEESSSEHNPVSSNINTYISPVDGKEYNYIDGVSGYTNYKNGRFVKES